MADSKKPKVCVIGLDGATFAVLDQWIAAGEMPNLADLIARGSRSTLISTTPPMTGPAWTSMTTGVNPGSHGIFDFFTWNAAGTGARAVQSGDVPVPRLWDLIGEAGRTVGVFNAPVTHPASPVNGFMVTGMLTPRPGPTMTHPPSLCADLTRRDLCPRRSRLPFSDEPLVVRQLLQAHRRVEAALGYLLNRYRPDFFFGVLQELDQLQHRRWRYCEKVGGGSDRGTRSLVGEFYRRLDDTIGRIMHFFGEETRFFMVSDHGFGPLDGACLLNRYLAKRGFLRVDWARLRRAVARGRLTAGARSVCRALGLSDPMAALAGKAPGRFRRTVRDRGRRSPAFLFTDVIDWSRTRAYVRSHTDDGIRVNVRGRDPHGIVEPGADREAVVRDLTAALEALEDPVAGGPLVTQIIRREEVYRGPYVHDAPDLFVVLRDRVLKSMCTLSGSLFGDCALNGWHRMDGVLVACGPGIKVGAEPYAEIMDVAPTVLHAAGLPIPRHVEGRCLTALFEDGFLAEHPVRHAEAARGGRSERQSAGQPTAADEDAVRDRLRRLGYL